MDDALKWKLLSSEYLTKHVYFTSRKDRCERADGTIIEDYFVVELPTSACALAITEEGKIILLKQYRHPIGEVIYEIPGGFVDEGEDLITGMKRELMEETGYDFSTIEYLGKTVANPGLLNNYTELFLTTGGKKTGLQKLDHNEEIEIVLVSMEQLIELLLKGEIKQSLHATCIFLALLRLGKLKLV
jgi:ADP-ribose pyrophosphatase